MKHFLVAAFALLVSSVALADLAERHQKNCETDEVKSLVGQNGSCRIVIAQKKLEKRGLCFGIFMGSLPCYVSYLSVKEGAAMNLTCGTDIDNPTINQDMAAEAAAYDVATLISTNDGKTVVKNDASDYSIVASNMLSIFPAATNPEIVINLQSGPVSLTDVVCQ